MAHVRLRHQEPTFTLPSCAAKKMTTLEYELRVGNITQEEYDLAVAESEAQADT